MIEYSRTAVVAHISQPVEGKQEGWGRPGTSSYRTITPQHHHMHVATLPEMPGIFGLLR